MSRERELLKQALYAFEIDGIRPDLQEAIKKELKNPEQEQQEPIAYLMPIDEGNGSEFKVYYYAGKDRFPVYTSPQKQKPLSDDEINNEHDKNGRDQSNVGEESFRDGVRFAEKIHRIGE